MKWTWCCPAFNLFQSQRQKCRWRAADSYRIIFKLCDKSDVKCAKGSLGEDTELQLSFHICLCIHCALESFYCLLYICVFMLQVFHSNIPQGPIYIKIFRLQATVVAVLWCHCLLTRSPYFLYKVIICPCCVYSLFLLLPSGQKTKQLL